jgi:hypothetical protein
MSPGASPTPSTSRHQTLAMTLSVAGSSTGAMAQSRTLPEIPHQSATLTAALVPLPSAPALPMRTAVIPPIHSVSRSQFLKPSGSANLRRRIPDSRSASIAPSTPRYSIFTTLSVEDWARPMSASQAAADWSKGRSSSTPTAAASPSSAAAACWHRTRTPYAWKAVPWPYRTLPAALSTAMVMAAWATPSLHPSQPLRWIAPSVFPTSCAGRASS